MLKALVILLTYQSIDGGITSDWYQTYNVQGDFSFRQEPVVQILPADKFLFSKIGEHTEYGLQAKSLSIDMGSILDVVDKTCHCLGNLLMSLPCNPNNNLTIYWMYTPKASVWTTIRKSEISCERTQKQLWGIVEGYISTGKGTMKGRLYSNQRDDANVKSPTIAKEKGFLNVGIDKVDIGYPQLTNEVKTTGIIRPNATLIEATWANTKIKIEKLTKLLRMVWSGKVEPEVLRSLGFQEANHNSNIYHAFHEYTHKNHSLEVILQYETPKDLIKYDIYSIQDFPISIEEFDSFESFDLQDTFLRVPIVNGSMERSKAEPLMGVYLQSCKVQGLVFNCPRLSMSPSHRDGHCVLALWNGKVEEIHNKCVLKRSTKTKHISLGHNQYVIYLPEETTVLWMPCIDRHPGHSTSPASQNDTAIETRVQGVIGVTACRMVSIGDWIQTRIQDTWTMSGHHTAVRDAKPFIQYVRDTRKENKNEVARDTIPSSPHPIVFMLSNTPSPVDGRMTFLSMCISIFFN